MSLIGAMSQGTQLNRMLDTLGMPDQVGDMLGAALDAKLGNQLGAMRNLLDGFSKLTTRQLDFGAAKALAGFGGILSPQKMLSQLTPALLGTFGGAANALAGGAANVMKGGGPMAMVGNLLSRLTGGQTPGAPAGKSPLDAGGADIRSIINNPNLSIEEKMALALMAMAQNQEDQLERQLATMEQASGRGKAGGGGGLGGLLGGGGGPGAAGGGTESEQIGSQKLQMIQQKMSRLLDTLSNIMKSFHQTSSTAIRNIN